MLESCSAIEAWLNTFLHKVPYAVIMLASSPIAVLLNLILIVSFIATRQATKSTANILIIAISFSDLTTAAISMPLTASLLLNVNAEDFCIKSKVIYLIAASSHFSVVLTVLLAIDRYLHMNPDIQNHQQSRIQIFFKKPNIYFIIVIIFIFLYSLYAIGALSRNAMNSLVIPTVFNSLLAVYMLIIVCLYTRGYLRIRKFTDNNPVYNESGGSTHTTPDYVRRLYKTVLVLILLAFFQYVPLCLIHSTALILTKHVNLTDNSTAFSYFLEIAAFTSNSGCFTNSIAVLYFNNQANYWILSKLGIKRFAHQSR